MAKFKPPFPGFGTPMPKPTANPFKKNVKSVKPPVNKKAKKGKSR